MLRRLGKIIQVVVRLIQKILLSVSLIILYILGLGLTRLYLSVFNRNILVKRYKKNDTFWKEAAGYQPDADDVLRQA